MFPMTHDDGLIILDEYSEQSAIGLGSANNVKGLTNRQHSRPSLSIKMGLLNPQSGPILQEP
jgi:hypothetical protein